MLLLSLLLCTESCLTLWNHHGLQPTKFLCPWDFLGKNAEVSCHFLLQGIFPSQGSNPCLLHQQADSLLLSHQGIGEKLIKTKKFSLMLFPTLIRCTLGRFFFSFLLYLFFLYLLFSKRYEPVLQRSPQALKMMAHYQNLERNALCRKGF